MPAGVDEEIAAMWCEALEEICSDQEFIDELNTMGCLIVYEDGEILGQTVADSAESCKALAEKFRLRK